MAVVHLDGALEVGITHAEVHIELRRVQHLLSVHTDSLPHPVFDHLATNHFNRDQKVLLAYPQQSPGAYDQEARLARVPVDVEVLYTSYLLACDIVDVEPPDVLPVLF